MGSHAEGRKGTGPSERAPGPQSSQGEHTLHVRQLGHGLKEGFLLLQKEDGEGPSSRSSISMVERPVSTKYSVSSLAVGWAMFGCSPASHKRERGM